MRALEPNRDRHDRYLRGRIFFQTVICSMVYSVRPPLRTPKNPSRREWEAIARDWYRFYYTYYERSKEERRYIRDQGKWLRSNVPAEIREGFHLLEGGGGFMGEDVYVVDGDITHTLHINCTNCSAYQVVRWGEQLWCIACNQQSR